MYNQITHFLSQYKLLSPYQHGFRSHHSTITACTLLLDLIYQKLDTNLIACSIFIDLSKAFDTINHNILLKKLKNNFFFSDNAANIVTNYLTNRNYVVKIDDSISDKKDLTIGVPQGSILGPLFFIMYINDLVHYLPKHVYPIMYADDTTFIITRDRKQHQLNLNEHAEIFHLKST